MIQHIVKTQTFNRKFLAEVFDLSREMRKVAAAGGSQDLAGKLIAMLFYEPSTRTRFSFEAAAARLGARIISTENASQFSSAAKGEILEDSIRAIHGYVDGIVLRHSKEGSAERAAHVSRVPVFNAGDGSGQHPTQALLDLFTIEEEIGHIDGLKVLLSGDLRYSRTIHSLAYLLGKFDDVSLYLVAGPGFEMPENITAYLDRHKVPYFRFDSLATAVDQVGVDVVYQTRTQKERFEVPLESNDEYREALMITRDLAAKLKSDALILHPLPRIDEIRYGVDNDPRAKYFQQAENGVYIRMALLKMLLG